MKTLLAVFAAAMLACSAQGFAQMQQQTKPRTPAQLTLDAYTQAMMEKMRTHGMDHPETQRLHKAAQDQFYRAYPEYAAYPDGSIPMEDAKKLLGPIYNQKHGPGGIASPPANPDAGLPDLPGRLSPSQLAQRLRQSR